MRAKFRIATDTNKVLLIEDLDGPRSITNDAEDVVKWLIDNSYIKKGKRLIYRDTDGNLDEIIHNGDEFIAFKFLNQTDIENSGL